MLPNREVDYDALENLIRLAYWIKVPDGIVPVGTTGESATLNIKEHIDVVRHSQ